MKKKILITTGVIIIIILLLTILQGKVNAATLQSNPKTYYKNRDSAENWMKSIRTMEFSGGAMGLSEKVNGDQTFKENSNNIDVHMMRNTEYGAIAILSVSGYGNSKTIPNSTVKSTTGNETGVYYNTIKNTDNYCEFTAGGFYGKIYRTIDKRYYDAYADIGITKIGDALDLKWQEAKTTVFPSSSYPYCQRNYAGYFGYKSNPGSNKYYSRGVAICGTGF